MPQLRLHQRLLLRAAAGFLVAATVLAAAPARLSGDTLRAAVRRIQNVCFAAYPANLVRRMTGLDGPVPAAVRDNPALQFKAFHAEDRREKGLFYPSDLVDMLEAFEAEVKPGMKLLDLGSGDGRVVFLAAILGAHATGIEWEEDIHRLALEARRRLADLVPAPQARLKHGDFLKEPLAHYDILFYFDSGSFAGSALFDKIGREMRPDARLLLAHTIVEPIGFVKVAQHGVVGVYTLPPPIP